MNPPEIFGDAKEPAPKPALPPVGALVHLVVFERARNEHVFYATRADEKLACLTPGQTVRLWPVRFSLRFWRSYDKSQAYRFRRGVKLECIHLGAGYYEYDGPVPEANGPPRQTYSNLKKEP